MGAQYIAAPPIRCRCRHNHMFCDGAFRLQPCRPSGAIRMKPFLLVVCYACTLSAPIFAADLPAPARSPPDLQSGIDKQYFDPKVRAADDFYTYVNGKWLETTTIPPYQPSGG